MRPGRWMLVGGGALLLVVLAGVWGFGVGGRDRNGTPAVATVDGPVITLAQELDAYPDAGIRGVLVETDGCLAVGGTPVVFVRGSAWDPGGRGSVTFPDGGGVTVGQRVDGGGGYYDVDDAGGLFDDAAVAAAQECAARLHGSGSGVVLYWQ